MKTSSEGVAFIAAREGIVTRAYRDVAGVLTIGVGHTAAAGPPTPVRGMTIARDEAMALLERDLPQYERRVAEALGDVPQHVFDGAVSFDFNTGAIHRASWVAAFRSGDIAAARARLMQWTKAGGRVVAGLVARRAAEAALIFDGAYGRSAPAEPEPIAGGYGEKLAALGFTGPGAVLAYQKAHPDLATDGILGLATRAAIDRDAAARAAVKTVGGSLAVGGGAVAAGFPWWAVLGMLAVIAAIAAWRWRDELRRLFVTTVMPAKAGIQ